MNPISVQAPVPTPERSGRPADAVSRAEAGFGNLLEEMVSEVNDQQLAADRAVQQLHAGGSKNLHEAMIAMEQADISMRLLVQMRNKAMEAYQEIMRLQV